MSGGEARCAMRARVVTAEPDLFLLDEPTADLDPAAAHAIMRLLRQTADAGSVVIVVLHAIELAVRHATRMVVMPDGRIVANVSPDAAAFGMRRGLDPARRCLLPDGDVAGF